MLQSVLNSKIIKGSKTLGLDLFIHPNGQFELNCMVLNRRKNKISIENKYSGITSIDQLADKDLKTLPVLLSIDGKGVLFKKVEIHKQQKLIHHILPNAKEADFYIQNIPAAENEIFVSAIRLEILQSIIDEFSKLNLFVTQLYIGPLAIQNLLNIIDTDEIKTTRYLFTKQSDVLSEISKVSTSNFTSYKIGDDEVYSDDIIAFASGLGFYLGSEDQEEIPNDPVKEIRKEFLYKRAFNLAGWFTLAFFFALLMLNYMFFNQYNTRLNSLSYSYNQNKELIKKLDTLKSEYLLKEQYFVNSGFLDASKLSYYADRLANSLPAEIQLSEMNIIPLSGKIKNEKPIEFENKKIKISGSVTQSVILNNWVKKIKGFDWINQVNIIDYNQEGSDIAANFKIEIDLK